MNQRLSKKSAVPIPEQRPGFMGMSGLYEGVMGAIDRRKIGSILSESLRNGADMHGLVSQAAEVFIRQSEFQQGRILDDIDSRLPELVSDLTIQRAKEVLVLAEFVRSASGHPSIEPALRHTGLADKFAAIAAAEMPSGSQDYDEMRTSCMMAAWALGYDDPGFWSGRIIDPLTRSYAVAKVLDAAHFDGWPVLMGSLQLAGPEIACSNSIKRIRFLSDCLSSQDDGVVRGALNSLLSLQSMPEELIGMVGALSVRSPADQISKQAATLITVAAIKSMMSESEENWFLGAKRLLSLYSSGSIELKGMLTEIGSFVLSVYINPQEDTMASVVRFQSEASMLMLSLSVAGIEIPGSGFSMDFDD